MGETADLLFRNGPVFRSDAARSWAHAVAVIGNRIVAVGGDEDVAALVGPSTEIVDLDGRMLCAGFQDAHVHPTSGGAAMTRCDLLAVEDVVVALDTIRRWARDHPSDAWVRGRGWKFAWFPGGSPSAALLDQLVPDRPAYFEVADGHAGWANTRALELAGVTAATADPPDGRIERLDDGTPQGTLHEGAMDLVERMLPPERAEDVERGLLAGQDYLFSLGVTAWQDAWVGPEIHAAYVRLAGDGRLRATVRGALWWDRAGGREQIETFVAGRADSSERYHPGAVKLMLDGVCENFTAAMLSPYLDRDGRPTTNCGIDMIDRAALPEIVTELVRHGFQPHFHAIGDAAVRSALDAVEAAWAAHGRSGVRPHIAHIQVIDPADVPRFRRLGVVANAQPLWAHNEPAMTDLTVPYLGLQRSARQYPFADLLRHGATVAMGSDWPVSTPDVMAQIHVATQRRGPGRDADEPFFPAQRITLADALVAFTAGAAFVNHLDDRGMIDEGNVADLVVLDRNPFEEPEVWRTRVDLTVVGGEIVYRRSA